jgi:hypothetical protein
MKMHSLLILTTHRIVNNLQGIDVKKYYFQNLQIIRRIISEIKFQKVRIIFRIRIDTILIEGYLRNKAKFLNLFNNKYNEE